MEAIEKLRTTARNMANGTNLENREECNLLLIIADEIEREIVEKYMVLPADRDYEMLRDIACMTHHTEDELAESWKETRREWAVAKMMEAD